VRPETPKPCRCQPPGAGPDWGHEACADHVESSQTGSSAQRVRLRAAHGWAHGQRPLGLLDSPDAPRCSMGPTPQPNSLALMCAVHAAQVTSSAFTEAEKRWLAENEPSVRLRALDDLEGISQGRQSRVSVLEYGEPESEQRVIWKRMGVGKRLSHDEARSMWQRLDSYKHELESCGWSIPQLLFSQVVQLSPSEHQIFSYEQFIPGGDGDLMLSDPREPNFRKWAARSRGCC